jgi:ATP phosphoribosyltransferase
MLEGNLAAVSQFCPRLRSRPFPPQSDEDWFALNTVIEESAAWEVIPRLKEAQAQGIVEFPLNKVVM